jgi:hypothetical protein
VLPLLPSVFESEQLELEEFSNTTPLLIERPTTPPQDFPDQKYFIGYGVSPNPSFFLFFFWVQALATGESFRNQEREQSSATIVPRLSAVADMTRRQGALNLKPGRRDGEEGDRPGHSIRHQA